MATTGIGSGSLEVIKWGATPTLIGNLLSCNLSLSMDFRETTNKDTTGGKDFLPTRYQWNMTGEAHFQEDESNNPYSTMFADFIAGTQRSVEYTTDVVGDNNYTGNGYFESLERSSPDADNATYNFAIKGTGDLAEGTEV